MFDDGTLVNGTKEFSRFFTFILSLIKAHVKINKALDILKLDKLPFSKDTIEEAYKRRAKALHPDIGGSEEAFKELQQAYNTALNALVIASNVSNVTPEELALKKKRDVMREAMLKKRAQEDYLRNVQATKWIKRILFSLICLIVFFLIKPWVNSFIVERNPEERMATVVYTDRTDKFFVNWQFEGETYKKMFKGRFVEGKWLISDAGMPVMLGNNYIVRFNASNPKFAVLKDKFISPETAEVYYNIVRHSIADKLGLSLEDPAVICMYWSILDRFGVDGLAHVLFSKTPFLKNWYHNENTYKGLVASEEYQNLYRSCLVQAE